MKIDDKELTTKGLRVYTTFDRKKMAMAKRAAERTVPQVNPKKLAKKKIRVGLVSVNTANGEVVAFYGGRTTWTSPSTTCGRARRRRGRR